MSRRQLAGALVLAAIAAGIAGAQPDPDPDGVGLYFDLAGAVHVAQVAPGTEVDLYLLLTNASAAAGVAGWECRIELGATNNIVTAWQAVGYTGSYWTPPDFSIGLQQPLPWAPAIHLLTVTVLVLDPSCCWFFIVPHPIPMIPGMILYADGADPAHLIPMHPATGGMEIPVAGINCAEPPLPAASVRWGAVRCLYR